MLAIFAGAISSVSSPRSSLPALTASASKASTAGAVGFCFRLSGSIAPALFPPGRGVFRPIERALFPDVEKPGKDEDDEDQDFHEPEHLQIAVHDPPRVQENGFDIEQNKKHSDEIKLDAETVPRVAGRRDSAFVRRSEDNTSELQS